MKVYKTTLDSLAKSITIGIILLLSGFSYLPLREIARADGDVLVILANVGIILFLAFIVFISYYFKPVKYIPTGNNLVIQRPFSKKLIGFEEIKEVRMLEPGELKGTIRTFGIGGMFGYTGKFYNRKIGHMTFYASRLNTAVLIITTQSKKIIISPDDDGFVNEFKSRLDQMNG